MSRIGSNVICVPAFCLSVVGYMPLVGPLPGYMCARALVVGRRFLFKNYVTYRSSRYVGKLLLCLMNGGKRTLSKLHDARLGRQLMFSKSRVGHFPHDCFRFHVFGCNVTRA